jgi:hypothetical protein
LIGAGAEADVLRRFQLARTGSTLLATSTYSEPLEQLQRLLTKPLFTRIRTLHLDFTPTHEDLAHIRREGRAWLQRLKDEREDDKKKRARAGNREPERPDLNLKNDAESLAFIQWAASQVYSNQRMVFVTGDRLLVNAYRRWYAGMTPSCSMYYQPFLLRRASQYLPVLNIGDSDNDISKGIKGHVQKGEIFTQLFCLIEIALLPLNLLQYLCSAKEGSSGTPAASSTTSGR